MGIKFNSFAVRGIDVSVYDGKINWDKVRASGVHFAFIRKGYGQTIDGRFLENWNNARGKVKRFVYWYMNYYSNHDPTSQYYGVPDEQWGKMQAELCFKDYINDYDIPIFVLDIESASPEYSPNIYTVWDRAQTIAKAFLKRLKELKLEKGIKQKDAIYCSISMTLIYDDDFKEYILWGAWYDEMMGENDDTIRSTQSVINAALENGWRGEIMFWQYASNGDIDDDDIGDGLSLGLGRAVGDLNAYLGTKESWDILVGSPQEEHMKLYYPLPEGIRISQYFGENPQWYPGSKGHNGIDWACPVGTNIYAMDGGVVIRADETSGKLAYGRHIRIQHDKGVSIYGHLSKMLVKVGDTVSAKQLIGFSGGNTDDPCSGFSTGAHLHAEYRMDGIKNPVPGGYNYNAIDILPLLVSHEDDPNITPLYSVKVIISNLLVRSTPEIKSNNILRKVGYTTLPIYEEKNGYGRINKYYGEWISVNPLYVERVGEEEVSIGKWVVTATEGLRIRSLPTTTSAKIGLIPYKEVFEISSNKNGWGKLYGRDGYCMLQYAEEYKEPAPVPEDGEDLTNWEVTSFIGLRIRSKPSLLGERLGALAYKEKFLVSSIDKNNWGKLYNRDGYCLLDYAKKI